MTGRAWLVSLLAGIAWVAALGALALPTEADGCAAVSRRDRPEDYVRIAEESAIIVWDVPNIGHLLNAKSLRPQSPPRVDALLGSQALMTGPQQHRGKPHATAA